MKLPTTIVSMVAISALLLIAFTVSGVYEIGADAPHWGITARMLEYARERAVERRAARIEVPPLDDAALIAQGARHYAAMCTDCHLAPGVEDSELRAGLYPRPPDLGLIADDAEDADPAREFQIIKHGLKMTAMPAWGATHDDRSIWGMVAFLQRLPHMNRQQYAELSADPGDHEHGAAHHHEPGASEHGASEHGEAAGVEAAPAAHMHEHGGEASTANDGPEQAADAFQRALSNGDAPAVQAMLLPDALIFESGGAESSAAEYAAHHLPADLEFLAAMKFTRLARSSGTDADNAWVATRSRMQGPFEGKDIDLDSTETLVLLRRGAAWRIAHIHWSSAPHRVAEHEH